MPKTIIIGLSNPHSRNSDDALAPHPERSSGWRLAKMASDATSVDFVHYAYGADRRNLLMHDTVSRLPVADWRRRAKIAAQWMVKFTIPKGSEVILLGHDVRDAFSPLLSQEIQRLFLHPQVIDGVTWRWLPHPSGRCRHYNDPATRALVGMLIGDAIKSNDSTGAF